MNILISDYSSSMMPSHDYEKELLARYLPGSNVTVYPYTGNTREFLGLLSQAEGLLTGFLPLGKETLDAAPALRCISLNATGFDNVDMGEAARRGIDVCAVGEYCTEDVSEHALALMFALAKNLKHYAGDIDTRRIWRYDSVQPMTRISEMTLGIFGFGKIGRCTAKKALALGMRVLACDPYLADPGIAGEQGVSLVGPEEIYAQAQVIINHMRQDKSNEGMFCAGVFEKMRRRPLFINVARGASVVEPDLLRALERGLIRGAGLDVLSEENPNLENHPLAGKEQIILTPHAAFYTVTSLARLQELSCGNLGHCLRGEREKVFKLVH